MVSFKCIESLIVSRFLPPIIDTKMSPLSCGEPGGLGLTWFGGKMKVGRKLKKTMRENIENIKLLEKSKFIFKLVLPALHHASLMKLAHTDELYRLAG